jgi:heat shock protein HtpX
MARSFIDVETGKSWRIILLFATLVFVYFAGGYLIFVASGLGFFLKAFGLPSGVAEGHTFLPSLKAVLVVFTLAVLTAAIHWILSIRKMIDRLLMLLGARPADPEDRYHLLLRNIVDEVSAAAGGREMELHVVDSRYLNAFAIADFQGRMVIGVTEGLLGRLNRRQLGAVVSHEAGHLLQGDSLETTVTCSMAAVYAGLLKMVMSGWKGEGRVLYPSAGTVPLPMGLLVPVVLLMRGITLLLNTRLSRERELRADAATVRLTRDPLSLAEALYVMSRAWRGSDLPAESVGQIFIVNPGRRKLDEKLGLMADLFSTHPPVDKRIGILLEMAHTDLETMVSGIGEKSRSSEPVPYSSGETEKVWNVFNEGVWLGPFSLVDLSRLEWLDPHSMVSPADSPEVGPAHGFKDLNALFKKELPAAVAVQNCPSCGQSLARVFYEGVPIWACRACRGRLFRREHIPRILIREEMALSEEIEEEAWKLMLREMREKGRYVKNTPPSFSCPGCRRTMERTFYRAILPYRIEVDQCRGCGLIWFDRHELELVQYLVENLDYPRP